ncbi:unnamed protein product [marine sediment metagenome]|uniref:Uncharacterized protein n=1 Tax=marine sediment metagenome TaxID=412755 RepID=X1C9U8_9ZZZZ
MVFWSNKFDFPLDYTAIHIWDKCVGGGAEYERIFERNGHYQYHCYDAYIINSTVAANFNRDRVGQSSQGQLWVLSYPNWVSLLYNPRDISLPIHLDNMVSFRYHQIP